MTLYTALWAAALKFSRCELARGTDLHFYFCFLLYTACHDSVLKPSKSAGTSWFVLRFVPGGVCKFENCLEEEGFFLGFWWFAYLIMMCRGYATSSASTLTTEGSGHSWVNRVYLRGFLVCSPEYDVQRVRNLISLDSIHRRLPNHVHGSIQRLRCQLLCQFWEVLLQLGQEVVRKGLTKSHHAFPQQALALVHPQ